VHPLVKIKKTLIISRCTYNYENSFYTYIVRFLTLQSTAVYRILGFWFSKTLLLLP